MASWASMTGHSQNFESSVSRIHLINVFVSLLKRIVEHWRQKYGVVVVCVCVLCVLAYVPTMEWNKWHYYYYSTHIHSTHTIRGPPSHSELTVRLHSLLVDRLTGLAFYECLRRSFVRGECSATRDQFSAVRVWVSAPIGRWLLCSVQETPEGAAEDGAWRGGAEGTEHGPCDEANCRWCLAGCKTCSTRPPAQCCVRRSTGRRAASGSSKDRQSDRQTDRERESDSPKQ